MDNLFRHIVPPEEWHPTFKALWMERNPLNECVIADWAMGFQDRDNKFVKEFQTTFNSSFWELYLFACLKHVGYSVEFPAPGARLRSVERGRSGLHRSRDCQPRRGRAARMGQRG